MPHDDRHGPIAAAGFVERVRTAAERAPRSVAVDCFERRWSYAALVERTARLAGLCANLGVGPGKRLGLLLPPSPTAAMAALAGLALGATVVPCDPLQRGWALAARLADVGPGAVVALDLGRLQDRLLAALDATAVEHVLVERMAELLPFPKNVLAPLMRGGEIAALPQDPRWLAVPPRLPRRAPGEPAPAAAEPALLEADGGAVTVAELEAATAELEAATAELARTAGGGRWLFAHPVDGAWGVAALLAPLAAGREVVVCPRLAPETVARALARERPDVAVLSPGLVAAVAERGVDGGPPACAVVPPATPQAGIDDLAGLGAGVLAWPGPAPAA